MTPNDLITDGWIQSFTKKKKAQWAKGDLRIIEESTPCITGIQLDGKGGWTLEDGAYLSYSLLSGNSRLSCSTDLAELVKQIPAA